jgi:hypothetical protein
MDKDRNKLDDANLSKVSVGKFVEKYEFNDDVCMHGSCGSLQPFLSNTLDIVCKFYTAKN